MSCHERLCDISGCWIQASKDCVQKTIKRLEEKVTGKVLHQILYTMYSGEPAVQRCVATALTRLANINDLKQVSS